jgi:hypothetical protein
MLYAARPFERAYSCFLPPPDTSSYNVVGIVVMLWQCWCIVDCIKACADVPSWSRTVGSWCRAITLFVGVIGPCILEMQAWVCEQCSNMGYLGCTNPLCWCSSSIDQQLEPMQLLIWQISLGNECWWRKSRNWENQQDRNSRIIP